MPHEVRDHLVAALPWQKQVKENDVGVKRTRRRESLVRRSSLPDNADVYLPFQAAAHSSPQELVVVADQDADHGAPAGCNVARVPSAGRGASSSTPPYRPTIRRQRLRPRPLPAV